MTGLVLPVLPDRALDPWDALNPRRVWLLAVLIAGVSFVGYFAMRLGGRRGGLVVAGLAGGLASSTAVTLSFARLVRREPALCAWLAAGTLFANAMMSLRVLVLLAVVDRSFALTLLSPMLAFAAVSALAGTLLFLRGPRGPKEGPAPRVGNPAELGAAPKFAALVAVVMLLAKIAAQEVGRAGVYALAAVSGLADVDALTLSLAESASPDRSERTAALAVTIGVAANTLAKSAIAGVAGTIRHAVLVAVPSLAALAASVGAYLVAR